MQMKTVKASVTLEGASDQPRVLFPFSDLNAEFQTRSSTANVTVKGVLMLMEVQPRDHSVLRPWLHAYYLVPNFAECAARCSSLRQACPTRSRDTRLSSKLNVTRESNVRAWRTVSHWQYRIRPRCQRPDSDLLLTFIPTDYISRPTASPRKIELLLALTLFLSSLDSISHAFCHILACPTSFPVFSSLLSENRVLRYSAVYFCDAIEHSLSAF